MNWGEKGGWKRECRGNRKVSFKPSFFKREYLKIMIVNDIPRSTLIKIGVAGVLALLLLSRCGGDNTEAPGDTRRFDDVPASDIETQLNDMSRIIENGLSIPTISDEGVGGFSNPNSLTREDFLDVWRPTTTPYDPACKEGCEELAVREGDGHGVYGGRLLYNPKVDDPVAQWSDCVMSITLCFADETKDGMRQGEMDDILKVCVQDSQCPSRCKDVFRAKLEGLSYLTVDEELENVFVGEQALCLPKEAWVDE